MNTSVDLLQQHTQNIAAIKSHLLIVYIKFPDVNTFSTEQPEYGHDQLISLLTI